MIVGRDNLIKMFPNFKDDIQENGIDLRVGEVYELSDDLIHYNGGQIIGCINDKKFLPNLKKVELTDFTGFADGGAVYVLEPRQFYFIKVDRDIEIPHGYCQCYFIRSTFTRCGLRLLDSWGDDGFKGRLMLGLYNTNKATPIVMGANERIIQAVTIENDGTASEYNGSYQNNKTELRV